MGVRTYDPRAGAYPLSTLAWKSDRNDFTDDPTAQFSKLLTKKLHHRFSGHEDKRIDAMQEKQRRVLNADQRKTILQTWTKTLHRPYSSRSGLLASSYR